MSKEMFASIKFQLAGKIFLVLGFLLILINGLDYLLNWQYINNSIFIIGITLVAISLYLMKYGTK